MKRRTFAALVVAGALLPAAGCGGGEENSGAEGTTPSGSGETIEISETDFKLEPATVSVDEAGTYTFMAVNDGNVPHALEIEGEDVEEETDTIGPGESAEVSVELRPGTYEMYCPIGDHRERGMEGSVSVAGGAAGGGDTSTTETGNGGEGY